jgi:hypothetical protein
LLLIFQLGAYAMLLLKWAFKCDIAFDFDNIDRSELSESYLIILLLIFQLGAYAMLLLKLAFKCEFAFDFDNVDRSELSESYFNLFCC